MYQSNWDIRFKTESGLWNLGILAECKIEKSQKNLADTAIIILPEAEYNKVLRVQDIIKRGDKTSIRLGYDTTVPIEFEGFVREITTNDSSLQIVCEDALFLFRNGVKDKQFKNTNVRQLAEYIISQIDSSYALDCDYNIPYDKYTIYQATGYDVLAKIQEETEADIFFDMKTMTLHIHPAYTRKTGEADYSMQHNIETSSLEYKSADDRKVEVTIESVGLDGKTISYTTGNAGGEKITRKVGRIGADAVKIMAHNEYKTRMRPGYEGSFDTWLFPYCEPGFTISVDDDDYPYKNGLYYVESVSVSFTESGGKRTITPSLKLSK